MRIGTLVRWTGESVEDYGSLGIISKETLSRFWVTWTDGEVVPYIYGDCHSKLVEIVCE